MADGPVEVVPFTEMSDDISMRHLLARHTAVAHSLAADRFLKGEPDRNRQGLPPRWPDRRPINIHHDREHALGLAGDHYHG